MLKQDLFQPEPSDEILATRIAHHDPAALETIFNRFASRAFTLSAMLLDCAEAERLVLQVFYRLWFEADQYNLQRGSFQDWFLGFTRTHILAVLERHGDRTAQDIIEAVNRWVSETTSQMIKAGEEIHKPGSALRSWQALQDLNSEQRCVIALRCYGGYKPDEIALLLGWPLSSVKQHITLGMQRLRDRVRPELVLERG